MRSLGARSQIEKKLRDAFSASQMFSSSIRSSTSDDLRAQADRKFILCRANPYLNEHDDCSIRNRSAPLLDALGVPRRFPFRVSGCAGGLPARFRAGGRARGQRVPDKALASRAHEARKRAGNPPAQPETRKGNPWNAKCILQGGPGAEAKERQADESMFVGRMPSPAPWFNCVNMSLPTRQRKHKSWRLGVNGWWDRSVSPSR